MSERTFKIEVRRDVRGTITTYYTVEAESFDEATDKFHDGYADWYDEDSFEEDDEDDRNVESVECLDCGCSESYCSCADEDDDDDDDDDEDNGLRGVNPNPGSATRTRDLSIGDIIEPADQWTADSHFLTVGGCTVTDLIPDGDTVQIRFIGPAGEADYWFAGPDARFNILTGEEADEIRAETERKRKAMEDRKATNRALHDLLSPTGGW